MENTLCLTVNCDLYLSVLGNCLYSPHSTNSKWIYNFFTRILAPFFLLKRKYLDVFQLALQFCLFVCFNPFYTLQILDSLCYKRTNEYLIYTSMEKHAQVSAQEVFGRTFVCWSKYAMVFNIPKDLNVSHH